MAEPTAASRGWGPGWPTDRSDDMRTVRVGQVAVPVHRLVAPVVRHCMAESERGGYRFRRGQCWGYANRPIAGTYTPSNHSWGLAVDLNSLSNPQRRPLTTDMPAWMVRGWEGHGFRWGGRYVNATPDAMHYEFVGTPGDARFVAANLRPFAPGSLPVPDPEEDDVDSAWIMRGDGEAHWLVRGDMTGKVRLVDPQHESDVRSLVARSGGKVVLLNGGQVLGVRQGLLDATPTVPAL